MSRIFTENAKAWIALAGAGLVLLADVVAEGSVESVTQIVAVAVAGAATYAVPNAEPA